MLLMYTNTYRLEVISDTEDPKTFPEFLCLHRHRSLNLTTKYIDNSSKYLSQLHKHTINVKRNLL